MKFTSPAPEVAVLGLGYVGLPLAIELGTKYPTIGFDINAERVAALKRHEDATLEVESEDFKLATKLSFSSELDQIRGCNTYIVTVPTPIDKHKRPDMTPLLAASGTIAKVISPGDVVIYESTVYPGATEEVCVPEIERLSGLKFNEDFFAGYSPERINPGDKEHRLPSITKVTSGSTPDVATYVDSLYGSIITAGTHKASSIKVAEAAKVIENTQRDINIALVNELAMVFELVGIDTSEVLAAAGTKWNFLPFQPGLVGGHCIGVDPYYLTHKAEELGYHPAMILAGRRINDQMGDHIANRVIRLMIQNEVNPVGAKVLVLGLAFKENCPDIRNTKVIDVVASLEKFGLDVDIVDPWVEPAEARSNYDIEIANQPDPNGYEAIVLAVAHREFLFENGFDVSAYAKPKCVVYDVKGKLPNNAITERL